LRITHPRGLAKTFLQKVSYIPQSFGSSGGQVGGGKALVLVMEAWAMLAWAVTGEALIRVVANAPVRARATTRARTASFIVYYSLFGYSEWADRDNSLDTPDEVTLGFTVS
jgi:hypothetical protein